MSGIPKGWGFQLYAATNSKSCKGTWLSTNMLLCCPARPHSTCWYDMMLAPPAIATEPQNESTGTKTFTLFGPAGGGTNLTAFHFETKVPAGLAHCCCLPPPRACACALSLTLTLPGCWSAALCGRAAACRLCRCRMRWLGAVPLVPASRRVLGARVQGLGVV